MSNRLEIYKKLVKYTRTRLASRGGGGRGFLNSESRINGRTEEEPVRVGYKYTVNGSLLERESLGDKKEKKKVGEGRKGGKKTAGAKEARK